MAGRSRPSRSLSSSGNALLLVPYLRRSRVRPQQQRYQFLLEALVLDLRSDYRGLRGMHCRIWDFYDLLHFPLTHLTLTQPFLYAVNLMVVHNHHHTCDILYFKSKKASGVTLKKYRADRSRQTVMLQRRFSCIFVLVRRVSRVRREIFSCSNKVLANLCCLSGPNSWPVHVAG